MLTKYSNRTVITILYYNQEGLVVYFTPIVYLSFHSLWLCHKIQFSPTNGEFIKTSIIFANSFVQLLFHYHRYAELRIGEYRTNKEVFWSLPNPAKKSSRWNIVALLIILYRTCHVILLVFIFCCNMCYALLTVCTTYAVISWIDSLINKQFNDDKSLVGFYKIDACWVSSSASVIRRWDYWTSNSLVKTGRVATS